MSRTFRLLAMLAGATVLILLVRQVGVDALWSGSRAVGWLLIPIVLLHAVVYVLNATAWWITLAHEPNRPPFLSLYRISVVGFGINFVTPVVNAGGEPYRVAALSAWLGTERAAGSVLQYVLLHALSSLLMWLTAVTFALAFGHTTNQVRLVLAGAAVVIGAGLALVLTGHRRGFVAKLTAGVARLRLGRVSRWLTEREATFAAVDAQVTSLNRERPARLAAAIFVDYLSRWVAAGELLLVAYGLGVDVGVTAAVMISGLSALAVNLFFMLPWELGSREGSLYLLFTLAGIPASVGLVAAMATRIREFAWCGLGLALAGRPNGPRQSTRNSRPSVSG